MPTPSAARSTPTAGGPRDRRRRSPAEAGLPDPRPVTDYTAAISVVAGRSRLTVTLAAPCIIRTPTWPVIDCFTGNRIYPVSATALSATSFYMDYPGILLSTVGFIEAPYQDMQVQNYQGGFAIGGGKWFRAVG